MFLRALKQNQVEFVKLFLDQGLQLWRVFDKDKDLSDLQTEPDGRVKHLSCICI